MPTTQEFLDMLEHYEEYDKFTILVGDLRELCWKARLADRLERVPDNTMFNRSGLMETLLKVEES